MYVNFFREIKVSGYWFNCLSYIIFKKLSWWQSGRGDRGYFPYLSFIIRNFIMHTPCTTYLSFHFHTTMNGVLVYIENFFRMLLMSKSLIYLEMTSHDISLSWSFFFFIEMFLALLSILVSDGLNSGKKRLTFYLESSTFWNFKA